ncbi:unnamed protein product [Sphenostylis stenocarpa]|uniref:Uncharacterized protein n=1 Tax=Sphenostylis stenocarpa TaxID=92480 RepID=A0AA86VPN1_9FABA|nr:unnamed protein product [Sphenostylis stenocarpa]
MKPLTTTTKLLFMHKEPENKNRTGWVTFCVVFAIALSARVYGEMGHISPSTSTPYAHPPHSTHFLHTLSKIDLE